jgi:hypothetical protein
MGSLGAAFAVLGIVLKVLTSHVGSLVFTFVGIPIVILAIAGRLNTKKLQGANAGTLQLRLTRFGYGTRFGKGEVELKPWLAGMQIEVQRSSTGKFWIYIEKPNENLWAFFKPSEKFWSFKSVDRTFSRVDVVIDGELSVAAQMLLRVGKWWGMPVSSFIKAPYYKRHLRVGPLTEAAGETAANHDQRHIGS